LADADLSRGLLEFADFTGAKLTGANLMRVEAAGADFSGADLSGANFRKADIQDARFRNITGREKIIDMDTAKNLETAVFD
jgi:uncharacterized protein YjbI with pentapeptide repeats